MEKFLVKRKDKDDCIVMICKDRLTDKYCFVNLTSCHVYKCRFDSIEDVLRDMDYRGDVLEYYRLIDSTPDEIEIKP